MLKRYAKVCQNCKKKVWMPTPQQIAEATKKIREEWTEDRWRQQPYGKDEWTPPSGRPLMD